MFHRHAWIGWVCLVGLMNVAWVRPPRVAPIPRTPRLHEWQGTTSPRGNSHEALEKSGGVRSPDADGINHPFESSLSRAIRNIKSSKANPASTESPSPPPPEKLHRTDDISGSMSLANRSPKQPTSSSTETSSETSSPSVNDLTPEQQRFLERYRQIRWQQGPGRFAVGSQATIQLPQGFQITDLAGASIYLSLHGNPSDSSLQSVVTKADDPITTFLVFTYADIGKVDDSDASSINADELLNQIRANTIATNELRKQAGQEQLFVDGWIIPPRYNTTTKRLEWACRSHSESGEPGANWDTRILGRSGVMSVKLVAPPEQIESLLPVINGLLQGFSYTHGNDYASWRSGDKVAAFGVAALVTGSTTAVAVKLGLFQKLWLFIAKFFYVIVPVLGGLCWRFLGGQPKKTASTKPSTGNPGSSSTPPWPALPPPPPSGGPDRQQP